MIHLAIWSMTRITSVRRSLKCRPEAPLDQRAQKFQRCRKRKGVFLLSVNRAHNWVYRKLIQLTRVICHTARAAQLFHRVAGCSRHKSWEHTHQTNHPELALLPILPHPVIRLLLKKFRVQKGYSIIELRNPKLKGLLPLPSITISILISLRSRCEKSTSFSLNVRGRWSKLMLTLESHRTSLSPVIWNRLLLQVP